MADVIEIGAGRRAKKLIEEGMHRFSKGELDEAARCFESSLKIKETAEGYTYWGWMLSFNGRLDIAIELCKKAISLDPDFGNPYNDIGTYYMKRGDFENAMPWLEKAKAASRYELRQYPYLNLGRIYLSQGMFLKALAEFEGALEHDSHNIELKSVIAQIKNNHQTGT